MVLFVGVNLILNLMHSTAYGGFSALKSGATLLQLHHLLNAAQCIRNSEKTEEYVGGRLFQAVLEVRSQQPGIVSVHVVVNAPLPCRLRRPGRSQRGVTTVHLGNTGPSEPAPANRGDIHQRLCHCVDVGLGHVAN